MDTHDAAYKRLFSHPEVIRDLLLGFIPGDWVHELDFNTLEKMNGSYVSDDLRNRSDDLIWRVRWGEDWLYVYLLLEFQSTEDKFMAVRLLSYIALLWQDLIRSKQLDPAGKLPPVLPVVLYNGEPRWKAPTNLTQLLGKSPKTLLTYQPRLKYLLLDEGRYNEHELAPLRNLVAAIFRLENSRTPQDIQQVLGLLIDWLRQPEQSGLRRSITEWLRRIVIPRRLPPNTPLPEMQDIQEVHNMLAERVQGWYDEAERQGREAGMAKGLKQGLQKGLERGLERGLEKGLAQGLEQGIQQGKQAGQEQGEKQLLTRLLTRRFGELPPWAQSKLQHANPTQIEQWSDRILDAQTLDEIFH